MVVIVTMGLQSQSDDIYISDLKLMAQKGLGLESGYEREMAMWAYYRIHGGDGISINYNDAVKYLKKLSERDFGDVASENFSYMLEAYNMLGDCYEKGYGVPQSYSEAVNWYRKAAEQGYAKAIEALKRLGEIK